MRHAPRWYRHRSASFRLERLEERSLLSTIWTVSNGLDSGGGSLRQAIADAAQGDTITFDKNVHRITLTTGELDIAKNLDIEGPGANKLTISGNDSSRVFDVLSGSVTMAGLTITDGLADGNAPTIHSVGGGILNQGDLTLKDVVVSHNVAVGAPNDTIHINPIAPTGMALTGVGIGGGVANLGTLTVSDSTFSGNQARGASESNNIGPNSFPGFGIGGGLANGGMATSTATVTDCQFTSNLAQGGNGCDGTNSPGGVAGAASGGAIANYAFGLPSFPGFAELIVSGSTFSNNQAIGGNDNQSSQFSGHAVGGAIGSHRLMMFGGSASLKISDSTFDHNQAIGGNHNVAPPGADANSGVAGGVFVFGTGTISDSAFDHNQAIGGQGLVDGGGAGGGAIDVFFPTTDLTVSHCTVEHNLAIGSQAGVGGTGGEAAGDGVMNAGGGATLTITGCIIVHNRAQGGSADTSGPASHGGGATGGGVFNGSTTYVIASTVNHNQAIGAAGSHGGNGGNGWGGGLYNDEDSTLALSGSTVQYNIAVVVVVGAGGSDGQGIGGGVYSIGVVDFVGTNVIKKNQASTSNDDLFQ
jgi:hypothetical protein